MPLATIQQINKLSLIPNADQIVVVNILEWQVVVRKDEFKEGQKCVFIELDSIVLDRPEDDIWYCDRDYKYVSNQASEGGEYDFSRI